MEASDRAAGSRYLLIDRDSGLVKFGDSPNFGDVDYNIPGVHSDFVPVYKKASLLLTLEAIRLEECCN
jgi:hypothetical protein